MATNDVELKLSGSASFSAAAAPGSQLRKRRWTRRPLEEKAAEGEAPKTNSVRTLAVESNRESKCTDGKQRSRVSKGRRNIENPKIFEDTEILADTSDVTAAPKDLPAKDARRDHTEIPKHSSEGGDNSTSHQHRLTASRLLIEITPTIRKFLETRIPHKKLTEFMNTDRIDLDVLHRMVHEANKENVHSKVHMADLVEDSQVVERVEAPQVSLEKLSFSERLRLMADERRHQAAVRSLWGERPQREDCFADINNSVAMGVNALLGIFLTFLGGYWAALYCGVDSLQTRVVIGLVCSFVCLVVEVLLFVIHDERQRLKAKRGLVLGPPLSVNA